MFDIFATANLSVNQLFQLTTWVVVKAVLKEGTWTMTEGHVEVNLTWNPTTSQTPCLCLPFPLRDGPVDFRSELLGGQSAWQKRQRRLQTSAAQTTLCLWETHMISLRHWTQAIAVFPCALTTSQLEITSEGKKLEDSGKGQKAQSTASQEKLIAFVIRVNTEAANFRYNVLFNLTVATGNIRALFTMSKATNRLETEASPHSGRPSLSPVRKRFLLHSREMSSSVSEIAISQQSQRWLYQQNLKFPKSHTYGSYINQPL